MATRAEPKEWHFLSNPTTGQLDQLALLEQLFVPSVVDLKGTRLHVEWGRGMRTQRVPRNLLERFLALRSEPTVLQFARRFGPLCVAVGKEADQAERLWIRMDEELDVWSHYRWEFDRLLSVAATVRDSRAPVDDPAAGFAERGITVQQLGFLSDLSHPEKQLWSDRTSSQRRHLAASVVRQRAQDLVALSGLVPTVLSKPDALPTRFDFVFAPVTGRLTLFGALVAQLLMNVTGTGFAVCSHCGRAFVPKRRKPAFGRRRYCDDCGRAAAVRDAKADYRARKRAGRGGSAR